MAATHKIYLFSIYIREFRLDSGTPQMTLAILGLIPATGPVFLAFD